MIQKTPQVFFKFLVFPELLGFSTWEVFSWGNDKMLQNCHWIFKIIVFKKQIYEPCKRGQV